MLILNGQQVKPTIFPDRTSQVWQLDSLKERDNVIHWYWGSEAEVFHLAQLLDLINNNKVKNDSKVYIPFLPYARQDKPIGNDATFALRTFWNIFCGEAEIITFDVHNVIDDMKTFDKDKGFRNIEPNLEFVKDYDAIIFPDRGAYERYNNNLNVGDMWVADKVRDQATGYITSYDLIDTHDLKGKSVIVLDDLCDGGTTFNLLGKELRKAEVKSADLYVSHGIFSKGVNTLLATYDKIITTDSYYKSMFYNADVPSYMLWKASGQDMNYKSVYNAVIDERLEIIELEDF